LAVFLFVLVVLFAAMRLFANDAVDGSSTGT
jgi:hypothetical protein